MRNVKIRFARKTGFRRLWIVATVIWLCLAGFVMTGFSHLTVYEIAGALFLPPALVYALAAALVWVIEGFARADR